ncbi:MAG: hypothetical protein AB7L65_05310 [Hyphomonadaceae bacterium]
MQSHALPAPSGFDPILAACSVAAAAFAGVFLVTALALAALTAAVVCVLVAVAAVTLRVRPRRRAGPAMLEGRKTAAGWVVEARAR